MRAWAFAKDVQLLQFQHVSVSFESKRALEDISFQVNTGETIVVCGATSSGKTVLLKTAIGLVYPNAGRVTLEGRNLAVDSEKEILGLRHSVGILFQESGLFDSLTVYDNVAYPLWNPPGYGRTDDPNPEVRGRVAEALEFVGLEPMADRYPSELSGGMRRRVGIARAIIHNPPLVLYDSPTSGLDPITAYRIMALLIRQRDTNNTASVVVTYRQQDGYLLANYRHDPERGKLVRDAHPSRETRFLVLREGRLVFEGSETEMEESRDPYVTRFALRKPVMVG